MPTNQARNDKSAKMYQQRYISRDKSAEINQLGCGRVPKRNEVFSKTHILSKKAKIRKFVIIVANSAHIAPKIAKSAHLPLKRAPA